MKQIELPTDLELFYLGPSLDEGPKPAFVYFSLSAEESLSLHPYHLPTTHLPASAMRIYSFTLPGHGKGFDKFLAMDYWAAQMAEGHFFLEPFFEKVAESLQWLIEKEIIDKEKIALGGLSRGVFVATHVAARLKQTSYLLGFAPLTVLSNMKAFVPYKHDSYLMQHVHTLDLINTIPSLSHLKYVRFYIGNRDTLVVTESCYRFIAELSAAYKKMSIELFISPSVGIEGHGTPPHLFEQGALWLHKLLLEK